MVYEHKELKYKGKTVFHKLILTQPQRELKPFQNNEACFMFVDKGDFYARTPDKFISFKKGQGLLAKCTNFFIETNKLQREGNNSMEIIGVYLFPSLIEELLQINLSLSNHSLDYNVKQVQLDGVLNHFKEGISILLDNPEIADEEIIKTKLKEFILLISKTENASSNLDFLSAIFRPNAIEFKTTIANNLYANLSVNDFAQLSGMSVSSFKRKFTDVYKESPRQYLSKMKLLKASKLLTSSNARISEIAYECGFDTISTFNRSFKLQFKVSPTKYRLSQIA